MTKRAAIHAFWAQFGWPCINEQSDIDEATAQELGFDKKRIEYEFRAGDYTEPIALTASLFHRSTSWTEIDAKADEIRATIGQGYKTPVDGGYLWITAGQPFTNDEAPADVGWRRIVLNINVNFLTST